MELELARVIEDLDTMQIEKILRELRRKDSESFELLKEIVEDNT